MNLIYELNIRESKSLPDFSGSDAYFVSLTLNGLILDGRIFTLLNRIGDERMESLSIDDFLIIDTLLHGRNLSENLRKRVKRLADMGIVERAGRNKFVLARRCYEATGRSGANTRLVELDREINKELVFTHIRKNDKKGTPLRELQNVLPNHSRRQIQVLLGELRNDERIYLKGKTTAARWFTRDNDGSQTDT